MTDLVVLMPSITGDLATEDVYLGALATASLAGAAGASDRPQALPATPLYVELRTDWVKHGKLPAEALPRWPMKEWDD